MVASYLNHQIILLLTEVPSNPLLNLPFNPIVTHFFAQSQASGTALFWAIHM